MKLFYSSSSSFARKTRVAIREKNPERWVALRAQALADGVMELAVAITLESRRPTAEQSATAAKRWQTQIVDALVVAEVEITTMADRVTIGHIAIAVALGYLDFRSHVQSWRANHPELFRWYREFSEREPMRATAPGDSSYNL
jgi:glutathione S-transferase